VSWLVGYRRVAGFGDFGNENSNHERGASGVMDDDERALLSSSPDRAEIIRIADLSGSFAG